ncbi:MAG TPA: LON peptidase substrate-binding domain-containing protein, partial [Bacilli bacterium]|nr:LON peptidase substrate-binding domain-containing protein [Bacilli bacterium]
MDKLQSSYNLPVVITRNQVYFPKNQSDDLDAGRRFTVDAIDAADATADKLIIVVTQRDYHDHTPKFEKIHKFGVLARLTKVRKLQHHHTIRFEPLAIVKLVELDFTGSYYSGEGLVVNSLPVPDNVDENNLKDGLYRYLQNNIEYVRRLNLTLNETLVESLSLDELTYYVANRALLLTEERMAILRELDPVARLELLMKLIEKAIKNDTVTAVSQIIRNKARSDQVKKVDRRSAEDIPLVDETEEEIEEEEDFDSGEEILAQLKLRYYPQHIASRVRKEVRKMNRVDQNEKSRIIEYLDWVIKLPYDQETIDNLDLDNIRKVLDKDHYGLKEPKQRIVEFMAVKRLAKSQQATVLCFYGPPGTGKTSLAISIATAMGRKLVKASLGGIDDESKLRGFLRTYVGSQPGNIIS